MLKALTSISFPTSNKHRLNPIKRGRLSLTSKIAIKELLKHLTIT